MLASRPPAASATYIERRLLNGEELLKWAEAQGFEHRLPVDELHISVALARVSPSHLIVAAGGELVLEGGSRRILHLDYGVVALGLEADCLETRRQALRSLGAELREPFRPHVTFAFDPHPGAWDVPPFEGPLRLGPEIVRADRFGALF